jgi:hypothetical protein
MVLAGLLLALTPGLPRVELAPELVLLLVLPPLIYSAGVAMSWREFRYNIRSISLLAVDFHGSGRRRRGPFSSRLALGCRVQSRG